MTEKSLPLLSIFEELFLLALDEERGNTLQVAKKTLAHGLAGAILAELTLLGRIHTNEKHRLELINAQETGDALLDEALKEIQYSEKPRKPSYWVSQLSQHPKLLRERIAERLVAKEVLYQEDRRLFWRYPASEDKGSPASFKFDFKKSLRASILAAAEVDLRQLCLLNIVSASGLLNLVFTVDELSIAQQQIHEKVFRAALENPVMQTVEDIEQAIITSLEDDMD